MKKIFSPNNPNEKKKLLRVYLKETIKKKEKIQVLIYLFDPIILKMEMI